MRSSSAAHLLQGSTCCAFRDALLHSSVVTGGYLSYCGLSISSNQSDHSPLTSAINKRPSSVNPREGCAWKSQQTSSLWCSVWPSADHLDHVYTPKCIELLMAFLTSWTGVSNKVTDGWCVECFMVFQEETCWWLVHTQSLSLLACGFYEYHRENHNKNRSLLFTLEYGKMFHCGTVQTTWC